MYQIINYYQENSQKMTDYKLKSRYLWDDHVSYTRNAIISLLAGLPDVDAVSARLIKNQEDIGVFISPYYSTAEVYTFVNLLKEHITIATDVIKGVEGAEEKWRMNGNDITNYMFQMNKVYWPTSVTNPLWTKHMDLTIDQVNARNSEMWEADIIAYDQNHIGISAFADLISIGTIYQNMDMFCTHYAGG